jgi:mRNA-degrading endonuclease RelE of RelBE toxin-antitoxin system
VKSIQWTALASRDLGSLDNVVARRIVAGLERYASTHRGDVIRLQDAGQILRLRIGDWRVLLENLPGNAIRVLRVLHRSQAYR